MVSAVKAPCHRTIARRITRFGWPPRWCVALGGAILKGRCGLYENIDHRKPANREKRCRYLLSLEGWTLPMT